MPYLRKKGKYYSLVEGVRDPATKKVKQRVLKYYGAEPDKQTVNLDIILFGPDNKTKDEYISWPKDKMKAYADMYSGYDLKDGQAKGIVNINGHNYVVIGVETGPRHITTVRMVEVIPSNQYNGKVLEYATLNIKGPNIYWGLKFMVDYAGCGLTGYVIIPGGKSLVLVNDSIYVDYMKRISKIYNTGTPLPNDNELKVISNVNDGPMHEMQKASGDQGRERSDNPEQQAHDEGEMPRLRDNGVQNPGESVTTTERGDGDAQ